MNSVASSNDSPKATISSPTTKIETSETNTQRNEVKAVQNVLEKLDELGIKYAKVEHEAVYTCEQAEFVKKLVKGQGCKNLFLKNKKKEYFLYTLPDEQRADLKTLGKENHLGNLSFANENDLWDILELKTGSVTPLGIINDTENIVTVLLDKKLQGQKVLVHPNRNTATISLDFDELLRFVEHQNHKFVLV